MAAHRIDLGWPRSRTFAEFLREFYEYKRQLTRKDLRVLLLCDLCR